MVQVNLIQITTHQFFTQLMRLKRQSFPTGTRDVIRRGPIGQQPYNRGLIGACGDFSWLRKFRQGQEFRVLSSNVVARDYSVQPTLSGFVARSARSK